MSDTRTGRCHCGAVTVKLPTSAPGVIACHCEDCLRLHGNYFAMIAAPTADIVFTGEEHIRWYQSSEKVRRSFCDVCGSRISKDAIGSGKLLISVGLFGPHTGLHIIKQVWEQSKADWYVLPVTA